MCFEDNPHNPIVKCHMPNYSQHSCAYETQKSGYQISELVMLPQLHVHWKKWYPKKDNI